MKKILFSVLCCFSVSPVFAEITLADIVDVGNWKQTYHTQTLTVCPNDLSQLCYRGKPTGLKLKKPANVGDQLKLTNADIAKRVRNTGGGTGGGTGNGGTGGGTGNGINAGTVLKTSAQVVGGLVLGAEGVDVTTGANAASTEKKTWGDVATSAAGTAMTVGGAAMVVNAIPAFGQVTYVGAIATGAAIGTLATGRKMFSETDCNKDPVRGFYACCNISNLTNIKAYRAEIGQEMWTENFPYVSTCMQGNKPYEANSWLAQRFLDDAWSTPVKRLCSGFVEPTDNAHVVPTGYDPEGDGKDICWGWTCEEGYTVSGSVCVPGSGPIPPIQPKTCKSQRTTEEGKACCDLPPEVAEWKNQQCICAGGKEFKINNGRGTCVAPENDGVPFRCPDVDISLFNQWTVQCASHSATISLITQIQTLCKSPSLTAALYNTLYAQVATSVAVNCHQTEPPVIDNDSKNKIIAAGKVLDGIAAGFDVSVWKNAQGEFNTARLASDSVAGVVLGTAGGLITSSVMKKKQAEQGFEDLKCVIGGQSVAGWGDEFNVGIQ